MREAPRLLIVDDSAVLLKRLVSLAGEHMPAAQIYTARSGSEAVEVFDRTDPALVVLDIGLPGLSGLEVLQHIRFRSATTEVLVCTNSGSIEMETQCRALGATHFLDKAHDITLLVELLRKLGGATPAASLVATV